MGLCDGAVNFIYAGDSKGKVRFGAIQNHRELLEKHGAWHLAENMSTVIVIQGREVYAGSTLAVCCGLCPGAGGSARRSLQLRGPKQVQRVWSKRGMHGTDGGLQAPLSRV